MRNTLALIATAGLAACSTTTGVVPMGQDTFMVSASEKGPGYYSGSQVKAKAFAEATQFCESKGKKLQVVNTDQHDTRPFVFASAEVQFMCLNAGDSELGRPKLQARPDKVVEVRQEGNGADPYADLIKLDDLRKRGIITDAEFEAKKKVVLAK